MRSAVAIKPEPHNNNRGSNRLTRRFLILTTISSVAIVLVGLVGGHWVSTRLQEMHHNLEVRMTAGLWQREVQGNIDRIASAMSAITRDSQINSGLAKHDVAAVGRAMISTFNRLSTLGVIDNIVISDASNTLVFSGQSRSSNLLTNQALLKAALDRTIVTGPTESSAGEWKLSYATPLYFEREYVGVALLQKQLDALLESMVLSSKISASLLVDQDDRIVSIRGNPQVADIVSTHVATLRGNESLTWLSQDGRHVQSIALTIPSLQINAKLQLIYAIDNTIGYSEYRQAYAIAVIGYLVVLIVALAIVYRFVIRAGIIYSRKQATQIDALHAANADVLSLLSRLDETKAHLYQSEKLASIGQLAAGIAHEINNPVGYVKSNLTTLSEYVTQTFDALTAYQKIIVATENSDLQGEFSKIEKDFDLEFIRGDVVHLLNESLEGIERVRRIVADMKEFSHIDSTDWQPSDLHKGLDSTLNIVHNELKYKATIIKEYGSLPEVECIASKLNQVFMNLLVNAAHAIEDRGTIWIRTGIADDDWVWVEVEDTGKGIPPENVSRLFEPFFTTKPVGKGTGLGLSVSYGIVEQHGGKIDVRSEVGKGSVFRVWLPRFRHKTAEAAGQANAAAVPV